MLNSLCSGVSPREFVHHNPASASPMSRRQNERLPSSDHPCLRRTTLDFRSIDLHDVGSGICSQLIKVS